MCNWKLAPGEHLFNRGFMNWQSLLLLLWAQFRFMNAHAFMNKGTSLSSNSWMQPSLKNYAFAMILCLYSLVFQGITVDVKIAEIQAAESLGHSCTYTHMLSCLLFHIPAFCSIAKKPLNLQAVFEIATHYLCWGDISSYMFSESLLAH